MQSNYKIGTGEWNVNWNSSGSFGFLVQKTLFLYLFKCKLYFFALWNDIVT